MTEDLLDYWVRLIKPFFPTNAWIVTRYSGDDHIIEIDWKLDDDPGQPNRRSRKIQITISDGAIEDYLDKNMKEREVFEIGLKKLIDERYNHSVSRRTGSPGLLFTGGQAAHREEHAQRMMTGGADQRPPGFPLTIRLFCFLMIHHPWPAPGQCPATFGDRSLNFHSCLSRTTSSPTRPILNNNVLTNHTPSSTRCASSGPCRIGSSFRAPV